MNPIEPTGLQSGPQSDPSLDPAPSKATRLARRAGITLILLVALAIPVGVAQLTAKPASLPPFCVSARAVHTDGGALAGNLQKWSRAVAIGGQVDPTDVLTDMDALIVDYRDMAKTTHDAPTTAAMRAIAGSLVQFEALVNKTSNDANAKDLKAIAADMAQAQVLSAHSATLLPASVSQSLSHRCPGT